ncbi:MAG: GAF domain-containing protein [Cytophagales bacterium]|nr:GAF domain-containing protein [Cytophagales bacterium]
MQDSISNRIYVISSVAAAIILLSGILVCFSVYKIKYFSVINHSIETVKLYVNKAQIAQQYFLNNVYADGEFVNTGTNSYYKSFYNNIDSATKALKLIENENYTIDNRNIISSDTYSEIQNIKSTFSEMAQLYHLKGFKDKGLEGKMRAQIHYIEKHTATEHMASLLMLRRHEKDFLLRSDMGYVEKFNNEALKFYAIIETSNIQSKTNDSLLTALTAYKAGFNDMVLLHTKIGLTSETGLRGKLSTDMHKFESSIDTISKNLYRRSLANTQYIMMWLAGMFVLLAGAVILSAVYFVRNISKPVARLQTIAQNISEGNINNEQDLNDLRKNKILKNIVLGFDMISYKILTIMDMIQDISTRKHKEALPIFNEKDEVNITLNKIISQLNEIDDEEKKRYWHNEGMAKFAQIFRKNDYTEAHSVYDELLCNVVKYTGALQGALYELSENEEHMEMKSCYAYDRKKYIYMNVSKGEGLTGEAWNDKEMIFITDVPKNYAYIKSGLGQMQPTCVVVIPLMANLQVHGLLELSALKEIEPYKLSFLQELAEAIGSFLKNNHMNEKTKKLLDETTQLTEQLRAQEEEMRQNMEELLATQETLTRGVAVHT